MLICAQTRLSTPEVQLCPHLATLECQVIQTCICGAWEKGCVVDV